MVNLRPCKLQALFTYLLEEKYVEIMNEMWRFTNVKETRIFQAVQVHQIKNEKILFRGYILKQVNHKHLRKWNNNRILLALSGRCAGLEFQLAWWTLKAVYHFSYLWAYLKTLSDHLRHVRWFLNLELYCFSSEEHSNKLIQATICFTNSSLLLK